MSKKYDLIGVLRLKGDKMKEIKLETNTTWSEPTQYMINKGAKLSLHRKEIIITANGKLTILFRPRNFWVMNDESKEELPSGGLSIDIPPELRSEFIEAIRNLDS